jgi:hypothetical protein
MYIELLRIALQRSGEQDLTWKLTRTMMSYEAHNEASIAASQLMEKTAESFITPVQAVKLDDLKLHMLLAQAHPPSTFMEAWPFISAWIGSSREALDKHVQYLFLQQNASLKEAVFWGFYNWRWHESSTPPSSPGYSPSEDEDAWLQDLHETMPSDTVPYDNLDVKLVR